MTSTSWPVQLSLWLPPLQMYFVGSSSRNGHSFRHKKETYTFYSFGYNSVGQNQQSAHCTSLFGTQVCIFLYWIVANLPCLYIKHIYWTSKHHLTETHWIKSTLNRNYSSISWDQSRGSRSYWNLGRYQSRRRRWDQRSRRSAWRGESLSARQSVLSSSRRRPSCCCWSSHPPLIEVWLWPHLLQIVWTSH